MRTKRIPLSASVGRDGATLTHRFAEPRKLVKYIGLNPAFDESGENKWSGGIAGHGRKDLRSLTIEAAQSVLRSKQPLAKWGYKLIRRKGAVSVVAGAVARKLTVAVWYLMMGRWTALEEMDERLALKVGKSPPVLGARSQEAWENPETFLEKKPTTESISG